MVDYEFTGGSNANFEPVEALSAWDSYRNHREIVTGFIKSSVAPDSESLCVLGAGLCRDIELKFLVDRFSKITLVDISQQDLDDGVAHQKFDQSPRIEALGGVDVFGIAKMLDQYKTTPDDALLDSIFAEVSRFFPAALQTYDCVTSTCLLSQLLFHATDAVTQQHPRFIELLRAIRTRHVQIMLNSLRSGGTGILVTDFVSTESLPELFTTTDLKTTLQTALKEKNFLHGLNPAMVGNVFNEDGVKPDVVSIKITDPWRWAMPERIYACFAIIFQKR